MNKKIWVSVKNTDNKRIMRLYEMGVDVLDTKYLNEKTIHLIYARDFNKIKKYTVTKYEPFQLTGLSRLTNHCLNNKLKYGFFLLGIVIVFMLSNIIVEVNVIHAKRSVRDLVYDELNDLGIKRLTLKKNYNELQKIKKKILDNNKETIEWLEIKRVGMSYVVRVEERIIVKPKEQYKKCNLIATKSGVVTRIISNQGLRNIDISDYVNVGDVLISGDIMLNEEIVSETCASGEVFGEVWYTINVSLPKNYEVITKTGKVRNNYMIKHNNKETVLLKSRIKKKQVNNKKIISLFGYELYLQKEQEIKIATKKYTESELLDKAIITGLAKLNITLDENAKIINRNVLKKTINDSKIELELFVSVEEIISKKQIIY